MGILPFSASSQLIQKLKFLRTTTEYNLVEMTIMEEEIGYAASHNAVGFRLNQYVNTEEPRSEQTNHKSFAIYFTCIRSVRNILITAAHRIHHFFDH